MDHYAYVWLIQVLLQLVHQPKMGKGPPGHPGAVHNPEDAQTMNLFLQGECSLIWTSCLFNVCITGITWEVPGRRRPVQMCALYKGCRCFIKGLGFQGELWSGYQWMMQFIWMSSKCQATFNWTVLLAFLALLEKWNLKSYAAGDTAPQNCCFALTTLHSYSSRMCSIKNHIFPLKYDLYFFQNWRSMAEEDTMNNIITTSDNTLHLVENANS